MKLIPASAHALRWLNQTSRVDLIADVERLAASILHLVPSCVGLSLTLLDPNLTLTLTGSNQDTAELTDTRTRTAEQHTISGPLDEAQWVASSLLTAAPTVRATLTMPTFARGRLTGTIELYAADPRAFDATKTALQALTGADSAQATTNADLAFTSRQRAEKAPATLEDSATINQAIGRLVAAHRIDPDTARSRLYDAAARERRPLPHIARDVADGNTGAA